MVFILNILMMKIVRIW